MDGPAHPPEHIIKIDESKLTQKSGLGLDFGLSVTKIVYAENIEDQVYLHFFSYQRGKSEEYMNLLKELAQKYVVGGTIHATGMGSPMPKPEFEKFLGVCIEEEFEVEYYLSGFTALVSLLSREDLFYSKPAGGFDEVVTKEATNLLHFSNDPMGDGKKDRLSKIHAEKLKENIGGIRICRRAYSEPVQYPAVVVICGSGMNILRVHDDGRHEFLKSHALSGINLLASSLLLAGTKTYNEIAYLSKRGSKQNLDCLLSDVKYNDRTFDGSYPFIHLGKTFDKDRDDIPREDLVASAVSLHTFNMSLIVQQMATILKARTVYFCGGVVADQHIREQMWKYYSIHSQLDITGFQSEAVFLKHGQYLGALGCLLKILRPISLSDGCL